MEIKYRRHRNKLAKEIIKKYRLYRQMGYSPSLSRINAHFSVTALSGGRKNMFSENALRRYKR